MLTWEPRYFSYTDHAQKVCWFNRVQKSIEIPKQSLLSWNRNNSEALAPMLVDLPPMLAKYEFSDHTEKNIQKSQPIKNFTLNNFALHDRFPVPKGLEGIGYMGLKFCHLRHIVMQQGKSSVWQPQITRTIKNNESITETKIIHSKISDRIIVLIFFSYDSQTPLSKNVNVLVSMFRT